MPDSLFTKVLWAIGLVPKSTYQDVSGQLTRVSSDLENAQKSRNEARGQLVAERLARSLLESNTTEERERLLREIALLQAAVTDRDRLIADQVEQITLLKKLTTTDVLTGLANRRGLETFAIRQINQLSHSIRKSDELRHRPTVSAIFFDLDHFKAVNDGAGHAAGDAVLRIVAQHALTHLGKRASDIVARLGGDEFIVIMPEANQALVQERAEGFRVAVETDTRLHLVEGQVGVTASIGIARIALQATTEASEALKQLVSRADLAAYAAKNRGRNTVSLDDDVTQWGGLPK